MADGDVSMTGAGPGGIPVTVATGRPLGPEADAEKKQSSAVDALSKLGQSGPPWASGLSIVLAALVSVVLALGLDVGGMTTAYINSKVEERQQANALQVQSVTLQHESETQMVGALNTALNEQSTRIGQLDADNQALRVIVLKLQFQVLDLASQAGLTNYPVVGVGGVDLPGLMNVPVTPMAAAGATAQPGSTR